MIWRKYKTTVELKARQKLLKRKKRGERGKRKKEKGKNYNLIVFVVY